MKAGTTTLYHDLRSQPGLRLPDKESNALLAEDAVAAYRRLFAGAPSGVRRGEVCPDYTKPGSEERAAAVARVLYRGRPAPRLIYLVREPIERLRSHHHFISTQHGAGNPGGMTTDLEASLGDFPELVETSRYATRLRPWRESFGMEAIRVVRFEDYVVDRVGTVRELMAFLGAEDFDATRVRVGTVYNAGDARPVATPFWRRVMGNAFYRRLLRPWLPLEWRDRIRARLLPTPPPRPAPPSRETLRELEEMLRPEAETLAEWCGRERPLWVARDDRGEEAPR